MVATPVVVTGTPLLIQVVVTVCSCVYPVHPGPVGPQPFQVWPLAVLNHGLPFHGQPVTVYTPDPQVPPPLPQGPRPGPPPGGPGWPGPPPGPQGPLAVMV